MENMATMKAAQAYNCNRVDDTRKNTYDNAIKKTICPSEICFLHIYIQHWINPIPKYA